MASHFSEIEEMDRERFSPQAANKVTAVIIIKSFLNKNRIYCMIMYL